MKVYLCYECYFTTKGTKRYLNKIFTDEAKAIEYQYELQEYDEWRELEERETE